MRKWAGLGWNSVRRPWSEVDLVAYEKFAEPQVTEVFVCEPNKKVVGQAFKKEAKAVTDAFAALTAEHGFALQAGGGGGLQSLSSPST